MVCFPSIVGRIKVMSEGYQSQLFKTVQKQVRHWRDTLQLRWRQVKTSTLWTAQYLLHTLDQLLHIVQRAGYQLKQATARPMQALIAALDATPEPDQALQNVLKAIEWQPFPSLASSNNSGLLPQTSKGKITLKPLPRKSPSLWNDLGQAIHLLRRSIPKRGAVLIPPQRSSLVTVLQASGQILRSAVQLSHVLSQTVGAKLHRAGRHSEALPGNLGVRIQGVASLLGSRRLVFITAEQQLLDILTPAQQDTLRQRIIWEVATYWRNRNGSFPWFMHQTLKFPAWNRAVKSLQAVVQSRKTLPFWKPLPLQAARSSPLVLFHPNALVRNLRNLTQPFLGTRPLHKWRMVLASTFGAIALLPFTLAGADPARANPAPALPLPTSLPLRLEWAVDPTRSRKRWLSWGDLFGGTGGAIQGKVYIPVEKTHSTVSATELQSAIAAWASQWTEPTVSGQRDTIDVKSQQMGYAHSLFDWLLHSLDRGLVWLENRLQQLWEVGVPWLKIWSTRIWKTLRCL
jgi:hypothetical protein